MVFLDHFLLLLFVVAASVGGLGYVQCLRRSQRVESQLVQLRQAVATAREQHQAAVAQSEVMATHAERLVTDMQRLQQTMDESERLLPGRLFLLQRQYEDAAKVFQETVATYPESREAHWLLGESLFESKRYVDALPHLRTGLLEHDIGRLITVAQCEQALGRHGDAEAHLLRVIDLRGEVRQEDLVALGAVQSAVDAGRAQATLTRALALNPYNSVARYQLIELYLATEQYEDAIDLATAGLQRNPADVGCCVSRAEAYFRRGDMEDEPRILDDLATAQAKNRKDYNIYRLRGVLYQRRATQVADQAECVRMLQKALETYEDGLTNVPGKFHAHLLAAESRVFLQLQRFDEAVARAQRAVEHHPGHVSNHLALAFARLAARQWRTAAHAADKGMPWAGWGGRVWLTAISVFANAFLGGETAMLRQKCAALAAALTAADRHFALSESWEVVRTVLQRAAPQAPANWGALVLDTVALLERMMTAEQYQQKWVDAKLPEAMLALETPSAAERRPQRHS